MDDDSYEDEPLLGVETFATEAEANAAGAELVSNGIGAAVEAVTGEGLEGEELDGEGPEPGFQVLVLEHEVHRAQVVLGLVEPDERPPANPEEPMKPLPRKTNWKVVVTIWLVALLVIPFAGFWLSYWYFSR